MKRTLSIGVDLISTPSFNQQEMSAIRGGENKTPTETPVEGGACCICAPGLSGSGLGANEKANH